MSTYAQWLSQVPRHDPTPEMVAEASNRPDHFPSFSVVVPTWNTREDLLRACLDSVLAQSYPFWQLVVADDASDQPHVAQVLYEYLERDDRVEVVFCPEHGHISATTNAALDKATGMYVAFLDHDDMLDRHALYHMARAIQARPDADILYSDEDHITEEGTPLAAYHKSAFNPDLLLSNNYICHLAVYERGLVAHVGGLRVGVEGSQDHDLLLRCLPLVLAECVLHVPRVLYHWRRVAGSVALSAAAKPYTTTAGIKSLRDYFHATHQPGVVVSQGTVPNTYRITWPLPRPRPLVSVIIPTKDRQDLLRRCLDTLLRTTYYNFEVLLVDNGTTDPVALNYMAVMAQGARVRVLREPGPFNFSALCNAGAKEAKGSLLLLLNNDVEIRSAGWMLEMARQAWRPEVGCVGALLRYPDGRVQHGGVLMGVGGIANHAHHAFSRRSAGYASKLINHQNFMAVTGACLMLRTELFAALGGLDEVNLPVAYNDVDLCLRAWQAGYWNVWTPYAELTHRASASRGLESPERAAQFARESAYMRDKWGAQIADDPFYHPYLERVRGSFELADPATLTEAPKIYRSSTP